MPEIIKIAPDDPDERLIARAVRIMEEGGVIVYPTETFYGLGANAEDEEAVERIFLIKGRDAGSPLPVIIGSEKELALFTEEIPPKARLLMREFWPGALTLVFRASPRIPVRLTAGTGKIGIRISSHPLAAMLAKSMAHPLIATSANPSGSPSCTRAREVIRCLGDRIDAVIDGGETAGGHGSTILDVTVDPPALLREGAIPSVLFQNVFKKT
ncbi:MAG: threonylcarbamoyl-AMP synthase [Deltaproteobacteria bacterium]|nr:threonylcarbamoyl-AMP synthase [Deltaproteobacteria bacterium]